MRRLRNILIGIFFIVFVFCLWGAINTESVWQFFLCAFACSISGVNMFALMGF